MVNTVAAIMLVVERHDPVHQALYKALVLAGHFAVRVDRSRRALLAPPDCDLLFVPLGRNQRYDQMAAVS